jgi:hypothetical protein
MPYAPKVEATGNNNNNKYEQKFSRNWFSLDVK